MALKEKLVAAINDLSTLEVATLTNKVDQEIDLSDDSTKNIFTAVKASLKQANLVGYSKFELDGDAINFVNQDDSLSGLVDEHKLMVSAAQESRATLFDAIFAAIEAGIEGLK